MKVRDMVWGDLETVLGLENQNPSPWSKEQLSAELEYPASIVLVAEQVSGELGGWCCARLLAPEAELLKICVRQDKRRTGIATRLFSRLEQRLQANGATELFLEVRRRNTAATSFYLRHGFLQVGLRVDYYRNPADDAAVFKKALESETA